MTRQVQTGPHIAMQDYRPPKAPNGVIHCQIAQCKKEQGPYSTGQYRTVQSHAVPYAVINEKRETDPHRKKLKEPKGPDSSMMDHTRLY